MYIPLCHIFANTYVAFSCLEYSGSMGYNVSLIRHTQKSSSWNFLPSNLRMVGFVVLPIVNNIEKTSNSTSTHHSAGVKRIPNTTWKHSDLGTICWTANLITIPYLLALSLQCQSHTLILYPLQQSLWRHWRIPLRLYLSHPVSVSIVGYNY
jgi:hypothetical protein